MNGHFCPKCERVWTHVACEMDAVSRADGKYVNTVFQDCPDCGGYGRDSRDFIEDFDIWVWGIRHKYGQTKEAKR